MGKNDETGVVLTELGNALQSLTVAEQAIGDLERRTAEAREYRSAIIRLRDEAQQLFDRFADTRLQTDFDH